MMITNMLFLFSKNKLFVLLFCMMTVLLLHTKTVLIYAQCEQGTAYNILDVNQVEARINTGNSLWFDFLNEIPHYSAPKNGHNAIFAGAIWIGAYDDKDSLCMAANNYCENSKIDFFSGSGCTEQFANGKHLYFI